MKYLKSAEFITAVMFLLFFTGCGGENGNNKQPKPPQPQTYSVSFNTNGGSSVLARSVQQGGTVLEPNPAPTRAGYVFDGWYTDNNTFTNRVTFPYVVTQSITLHANWTPELYIVDISEETDWDFLIAASDGSSVFFNVDENSEKPTKLLLKPDKNSADGISIFFDDNGLPETAVMGNYVFVFGNFRNTLFDFALIHPDKHIDYFYDIDAQIDWDNLQASDVSILFFGNLRNIVKFVSTAVNGVLCATTPITGVGAFACVSLVVDVVTTAINPVLSDISGGVLSALGCATSFGLTCILDAAVVATDVIHYSTEFINSLSQVIDQASGEISARMPGLDTVAPTIPRNLMAVTISATQINLTWTASTDNVGVVGYIVYRNDMASPARAVNTNSYSDIGLTTSTQYCYQVSAFDAAGNESGRSSQACAITLTGTGNLAISNEYEKISAGEAHAMFIKSDGSLWAWGNNSVGQLGDGTDINRSTPVRVGTDTNWAAVSAGDGHTVAIKTDGSLWAWGSISTGQTGAGIGGIPYAYIGTPRRIGTDTNWAVISAGHAHTVALKKDGSLWAWGWNSSGQLGDGSNIDRYSPVRVGTGTNWSSISAGDSHTVALRTDGSIWAWGSNFFGKLGDGTSIDRYAPVRIGTDANWSAISAGYMHTIALKTDGSLWSWGTVLYGGTQDSYTPIRVGMETTWAAISAGTHHNTALKKDGSLWAWGSVYNGQLGPFSCTFCDTPVRAGTGWSAISTSDNITITLGLSGNLWVWINDTGAPLADGITVKTAGSLSTLGNNGEIRLGDGVMQDRHTPVCLIDGVTQPPAACLIAAMTRNTTTISAEINENTP